LYLNYEITTSFEENYFARAEARTLDHKIIRDIVLGKGRSIIHTGQFSQRLLQFVKTVNAPTQLRPAIAFRRPLMRGKEIQCTRRVSPAGEGVHYLVPEMQGIRQAGEKKQGKNSR
jgi:hypothetical protein